MPKVSKPSRNISWLTRIEFQTGQFKITGICMEAYPVIFCCHNILSLLMGYRTKCVDRNHYPPAKGCNGNRLCLPSPHREIPFERCLRPLSESTGASDVPLCIPFAGVKVNSYNSHMKFDFSQKGSMNFLIPSKYKNGMGNDFPCQI